MIYLAAYEPGGSLYNREREHILGRSLLNFGLMSCPETQGRELIW